MSVSRLPKEIQSKVFELTLALYRVTDFFPEGEALRRHLRQKANDVLGSVAEYSASEDQERAVLGMLAHIQTIHSYLGVARAMRFVKPINLTVLEREYRALEDFFTRELDNQKTNRYSSSEERKNGAFHEREARKSEHSEVQSMRTSPRAAPRPAAVAADTPRVFTEKSSALNDRQKTILAHIEAQKQARISDFFHFFDGISSKTIQRDLHDLVSRDILKREGEKRWTTYTLNV